MWTSIHTRLQEICIELWPTVEDCRALVAEAEIDSSRMTFGEPPALRWESVILQCHNQRSLAKLVPVLLSRYSNNPALQSAVKPWIHGNPEEPMSKAEKAKPSKPKMIVTDESGTVKLEAPTTIVVSTPGSEQTEEPQETNMVPVVVPKEMVEEATQALVATINSLRKTIAQHEKDLQELIKWRQSISALSRAEVAVVTGGNEK